MKPLFTSKWRDNCKPEYDCHIYGRIWVSICQTQTVFLISLQVYDVWLIRAQQASAKKAHKRAKRAVMIPISPQSRARAGHLMFGELKRRRARPTALWIVLMLAASCAPFGAQKTDVANPPSAETQMAEINTNPLSPEDAVRLGILNSNDVRLAKIVSAKNKNSVLVAKSAYWPELFVSLSPTSERNQIANASAGARFTLYAFGARAAQIKSDEANLRASDYEIIQKTDATTVRVLKAYIDFATANVQANLAQTNLKDIQTLQASVESRVQSGASSAADLNEMSAGVLRAKTTLLDAEKTRDNARVSLMSLTGIGPQSVQSVQLLQSKLAVDPALSKKVPVFDDFPSILALKEAIVSAEERLKSVKAGRLPSLSLEASSSVAIAADGETSGATTRIGPSISNVFSLGGGQRARVASALLDVSAARTRLNEESRNLQQSYQLAKNDYAAAKGALTQRSQIVLEFSQMSDIFLTEYESGSRSLAEVIDIKGRLFGAQSDEIQALKDSLYTALALKQATGELPRAVYKVQ